MYLVFKNQIVVIYHLEGWINVSFKNNKDASMALRGNSGVRLELAAT